MKLAVIFAVIATLLVGGLMYGISARAAEPSKAGGLLEAKKLTAAPSKAPAQERTFASTSGGYFSDRPGQRGSNSTGHGYFSTDGAVQMPGGAPQESDLSGIAGLPDSDEEEGDEAIGRTPPPAPQVVAVGDISQEHADRCVKYAPIIERLRAQFCPSVTVAETCALWHTETRMALGETRGEKCPDSDKEARGCTQFIDDTWNTHSRDGDVPPDGIKNKQHLEDAMASTLNYLCYLKTRVRTDEVYKAYHGGPGFNRDPARSPRSHQYDGLIRSKVPAFTAFLEGTPYKGVPEFATPLSTEALAALEKVSETPPTNDVIRFFPRVPVARTTWWSAWANQRARKGGRVVPHAGVDLGCDKGVSVYAIESGTVIAASDIGGITGKIVTVRHEGGYESSYMHLDRVDAQNGARVTAGTVLGTCGTSGTQRSPAHVHFKLTQGGQIVNPCAGYPGETRLYCRLPLSQASHFAPLKPVTGGASVAQR